MLAELPCWVYLVCYELWLFLIFLLKCAEAGWLLQVSFLACFCIVVTLDMHIVILGDQNLSFGRPSASALALWEPFWQLGDTLGLRRLGREPIQIEEENRSCSGVGSQVVRLRFVFFSFLEGSTLDPLAPAQLRHSLSFPSSRKVRFLRIPIAFLV